MNSKKVRVYRAEVVEQQRSEEEIWRDTKAHYCNLLIRAEGIFTNVGFDGTTEDVEDLEAWLAETRELIYSPGGPVVEEPPLPEKEER